MRIEVDEFGYDNTAENGFIVYLQSGCSMVKHHRFYDSSTKSYYIHILKDYRLFLGID